MTEKKSSGRRALSSSLRLLVASLIAFPPSVWANPVLDSVAAGSADISSSGSTLTVIQHTDAAIINWTDFSIAHGELTQFIQPSSLSAALNRVTGGNPSAIYGTLQANGRIFLINPNGVMVGPTGVINTQGFLASTLDTANAAFLSGGAMTFSGASAAGIVNAGRINALGGDAVLIARTVENSGQLIAADGLAAMAAGSEVLLMPAGEERVFIKAGAGESAVGVDQKGEIKAATAELKAAGGNVYGLAINNAGVIRANGVERRGGRVYLTAEDGNVALKSGSVIDASGENGGGTVMVKGKAVTVEAGASVNADATRTGDGGVVALLGSESMDYKGSISARGGEEGGNGGEAEVSGLWLLYEGFTDLRASRGLTGTLLLDPTNLTISNNSGSSTNINVNTLATQLNAANVTVQTSGSGGQDGDITVNNTISWTSNNTLTLLAHDDLIFNSGVTNTSGAGALVLTTANGAGNQDITLNANILTRGAITFNGRVLLPGDRTIASNNGGATGGNIVFNNTVNGGNDLVVNSGAGNVTFGASVGGTDALDSLTVGAGAGSVFLGAAAGSTAVTIETNDGGGASGNQIYNKAVSLNQNATVTSGGGDITFASTINGGKTLSVNSGSGVINLSGLVGNVTALTSLTTVGSGQTNVGSGVSEIRTTGVQTYGSGTTMVLAGNTALTTTNNAIFLNGSVNGSTADSRTLTLNTGTAGATLGNIGTGTRLQALVATGVGGTINLNGTVNTNAAQSYSQAVNLNGASGLTTGNGEITLSGAVNGGQSLTLNSGSQATNLNGTIGATTRLGTLTVNGTGTNANVNNSAAIRTGTQNWNKGVNLLTDATLDSAGSVINLNGAVTGANRTLTLASGSGAVNLGDVGATGGSLQAVNFGGTGPVDLGGSLNTVNGFNFTQNVTLSAASAINVGGNNGVIFGGTLNNLTNGTGNSLVVNNGSGSVSFASVGATNRIGALTVGGAGGTATLNTASQIRTGAQIWNKDVVLTQNASIDSNGGNLAFNALLNGNGGNQNLTIANVGNTTFGGAVGGNNRLGTLSVSGSGTTNVNGGSINSGAITINDPVSLGADTTLTSNGGAVSLNGTVTGAGRSLSIVAGAGSVALDAVGGAGAARLNSVGVTGTGSLDFGGAVYTTNAQSYTQNVTLSNTTTLDASAGGITLAGTVNGGSALTLNAGAGDVTLGGAVGASSALDALTITGTGTTFLNGGSVRTDGDGNQSYGENVVLGANTTLTTQNGQGGVTFSGTVNGARTLTVNMDDGDLTFGGAVGNLTHLTALTVNENGNQGETRFNGGAVTTDGAQTYRQDMVVGGASPSMTFNSNGGSVLFDNNLDGDKDVVVNAGAGNVTFTSDLGGSDRLNTLTINGTGTTLFDGAGDVRTNGAQTYNERVTVNGGSANLDSSGGPVTFNETVALGSSLTVDSNGGDIRFNKTVDSLASNDVNRLTVRSDAGNTYFEKALGGTIRLGSVSTTGSGTTFLNGGSITADGDINLGQKVLLGADTVITVVNSSSQDDVLFGSTLNGPYTLGISANSADVTFNGAVGGTAKLASLNITATGTGSQGRTIINGGSVATTGLQAYGQDTALGNTTSLTTTGGAINFARRLDSVSSTARALSIDTVGGDLTFTGAVGTSQRLASLLVAANAGTTHLNDSNVNTTGAQTYGQKVSVGGNETLSSSSNGNISFAGTVNAATDGSNSLTATTGGQVSFNNVVGGVNKLSALTTNGAGSGTTLINTTNINTTGAQNYNATVLAQTAQLTSTNNGAINFNGTLNAQNAGVQALTATTGGQTSFNGTVGTTRLSALTVDGAGTTRINTTQVNTTGAQNYNAATVTQNAVLNSSVNGDINFNGTLDGPNSLTAQTGGTASFNGVVGGASRLSSLNAGGAALTNINTSLVQTTGAQTYGTTKLSQTATLNSNTNGAITVGTVDAAADGVQGLTAQTGAAVNFNGVVGGSKKLAALTTNGLGTTNINTSAITTTGDQNYNATVLQQTAHLTATAGGIAFNGTLNAAGAGAQALTATASGETSFNGLVGTTRLSALTVDGAGTTKINTTQVNTTGAQNYNAATVTQDATLNSSESGAINFNGTLDGPNSLTAQTDGEVSFNGVVGGVSKLSALTTAGLGTTNINTTGVNTTGAQNYGQAVALGSDASLSSDAGAVTFSKVVSGAKNLTVNALTTNINGGSVNVQSQAYNSAVVLGADAVLTSVDGTVFSGAVSGPWSLTSNAANTDLNGGSVNTQSQTYNSVLNLGADAVLMSVGDTTFSGAVAGPYALTSNAANTNVNGGSVSTLKQTYYGAVNLGAATTLDANGSDLTLNGAVTGAHALTLNAGGIYLNGGSVNTGAQQYNGDVILGAHTVLDSNGGAVSFGVEGAGKTINGVVDGAQDLTINAGAGDVNLFGAVGDVHPLRNLTIGAGSGTTDINGGAVTTIGDQSYGQKVRLSADTLLTSNGGNFNFYETVNGTVAGEQSLTVDSAAGDITFWKDIGDTVPLEFLSLLGTGAKNLYGTVYTYGNQDYWDDLVLLRDLILYSFTGTVTFHKTVSGGHLLSVNTTTGDINFNGAVGYGALGNLNPLSQLILTGSGLTTIAGGIVETSGAQSYGQAAFLAADTRLASNGGLITFGSTWSGLQTLDADAGIGSIALNGGSVNTGAQTYTGAVSLGADADLDANGDDITINGAVTGASALTATAANINLNGGSVNIGAQTYNGALNLGADATLTSVGDTTLNGAVSGPWTLTSNAAATNINGGSVDTLAQAYNGAVALGANTNLNANGAGVDLNGKVNGAYDLIIDASDVTLHDAVGDMNALKTLTLNGATILAGDAALSADDINVNGAVTGAHALTATAANINLNGGSVDTQSQSYTGALNLGANTTLTSVGDTTFNGAVSGPWALTSNAANTNVNGGSVNTGAQTYNGAVVLGANTALNANGADIALNGAVSGNQTLTIDAANINLNAGTVNTGAQTYNGELNLVADATLTSNDGAVAFNGGVNGDKALTVNAGAGDIIFAAGVGDLTRLASLETSGSGTTRLNLGSALTSGDQIYGQDLALVADTTLDSASGDATFGGAVSGAQTLTVNAVNTNIDGGSVSALEQIYNSGIVLGNDATLNANGADVTLNGAVSGASALTIDAANINLNAGTVNTGAQTYNGELNLVADATLTSNDGAVAFNGGVNGAKALTVNGGAGDITFAAGVGDATRLASLETSGSGTTRLNLGAPKTSGDQIYGQDLALVVDTTLDSASGEVTFGGAVSGARTLTVDAANTNINGGSVDTLAQTYNGAVNLGANADLNANGSDITLNGAVTGTGDLTATAAVINLNGGSVNAGAQTYNGAVALGDDTTLDSNDGAVAFNGTVDGAQALTVNAGAGDVTFADTVGDSTHLTSLTIGAGAGVTHIDGGAITTDGAQSYGQKVVLGADAWLASNGGGVDFHQTVNALTYGGQGLTVDSAAGDINFWDAIGDVMPLKYLTLLGTGAKNLYGAVNTTGNQDYWNDLFLLNDLIINSHGGNVTFHQRVDGAHKLEVNADSGNIGFYGAIGGLMPLSSLILTGTGLTTLADGRVTTNGAQSYGQAVLFAADARLASNGGLITFGESWSGAHNLDVDAGAGAIELNGGTVDALAQTYTGAVTLGADTTLTSDGGAVVVNGAIAGGAHALTIDATLGGVEVGSLNSVPDLSGAGDITLNGPVSAGAVTLSGNDAAWNDSLSATDLRVFGRDVLMGGDVTTSGNDGVLLVAGRSFKNEDSHTIAQTGTGRFLIYSVAPQSNVLGGLTGETQWSSTYKDGPAPGFSGDGFLYSDAAPAPIIIDVNLGAINNIGGPGGNNGLPGFFGDFSSGGDDYVADNWSASPSDIFNWDLGTVRDAVASPDDETPAAKRKRKAEQAKKKSIWFKVPGE